MAQTQSQRSNRTLGAAIATFQLQICHVTSGENIADVLWRLNKIPASKGYVQDEENVREVTLQAVPMALRVEEIEEVPLQDKELHVVREALEIGRWSKDPVA